MQTSDDFYTALERQHENLPEIRAKHAEKGRPVIIANKEHVIALYIDGRKEIRGKNISFKREN